MKHAIPNVLGLLAASAFGFEGFPQADRMEPKTAKVGMVLTVTGRALDKEFVDEVFLTDHRFDMKVKVIEQSGAVLRIRIPPFAKPGRLQLLLLTAGDKPAYLEQPLFVQVEEADLPPAEVTQSGKTIEIASVGSHIPVPREEPPVQQVVAPAPVPASPAPIARVVTPARLIRRTPVSVPAGFPPYANDSTVELSIRVRVDGRVGAVKVLKGNPMLAAAAARSVQEWLYECARLGSTPVESDLAVAISFKR